MKKFSFVGSSLVLISTVVTMTLSCQKDASTTADAASENNNVSAQAVGRTALSGSVNGSYAAALSSNYQDKSFSKNQPLYVAFAAKDLNAFIANLQNSSKSDSVYVNFGVYGKGAPAPFSRDNGRLTIFFTGNKVTKKVGAVRAMDVSEGPSDFLNHGDLNPPPKTDVGQ